LNVNFGFGEWVSFSLCLVEDLMFELVTGLTGEFEDKCINTIRFLCVDAVQQADSGHPGMPMEASTLAYLLWTRAMVYNPRNPQWVNRDRFVLSAGHGSALLYSMLHLAGYDLGLDDLKNFRQWGSLTPGHPEYGLTPGVETTTGPLGQGFATGVGMAMAERYLAGMFNRDNVPVVDYRIYALVSDGDLMEGVTSEAASLAGHLGLGKIIYVYLDNKITIEGSTDLTFTDDTAKRFEAYHWHVQNVDGYDRPVILAALDAARQETGRPSLIIARTRIGSGSPNKENTASCHGAPLGVEETGLTKQNCGWPLEPELLVPDDVQAFFRRAIDLGEEKENTWQALFTAYRAKHPDLAARWDAMTIGIGLEAWTETLPRFTPDQGPMATRSASGKVLNAIAPKLPGLIGGSADLAPSNNTWLKAFGEYKQDNGPNIHFGVREHAMGSILNGLALSRFLMPYGGTFLVFADYMKPAIRLAALMDLRVIYVFTHDSIGLGEDGPTHQPVEHLSNLRSIPNMTVIRPADAQETVEAWVAALTRKVGPTALILSRQNLPIIDRTRYASADGLHQGAYILSDCEGTPAIILIGTGAEVHLVLEAAEILRGRGVAVRVVNAPSWEIFERQDVNYRREVLPPDVTRRLAVEAASPYGWDRYVGAKGDLVGVNRFGASAPAKVLFEKFGFNVEHIVQRAERLLAE
jgi:transketolase